MPKPKSPYRQVRRAFSQQTLKRVCEMHEDDFAEAYDMDVVKIQERGDRDNFYLFKDNGSDILAVAHLDTVIAHDRRTTTFAPTQAGPVVHSGALDDRLGAYTILELLPKVDVQFDILLTVGEESGRSTAEFFDAPEGKEYNWMIEFDRGGTDVVMYQYDDMDLRQLVRRSGAQPADGIFSDISYMEHLEIKGLNWGVGYRDYHGPRGYAYLEDYWMMIGHFLKFHEQNKDTYLPHDIAEAADGWWGYGMRGRGSSSSRSSSGLWGGSSSSGFKYQSSYRSQRGENWWDSDDAIDSEEVEIEEVDVIFTAAEDPDDDTELAKMISDDPELAEMISEDFRDVNRALTAARADAEDDEETTTNAGDLRSLN